VKGRVSVEAEKCLPSTLLLPSLSPGNQRARVREIFPENQRERERKIKKEKQDTGENDWREERQAHQN